MMKDVKRAHELEPGLLSIFRGYVVVRTISLFLTGLVMLTLTGVPVGEEMLLTAGFYSVEAIFLLGYLYWPWGQRRLGRWYLPIAILVAAASPIVQVRYILSFGMYGTAQNLDLWLIFPFLTVPLILTAWQYSFNEVLVYCLGTTLIEIVTLEFLSWTRDISMWVDAGNLIARVVFLMAIGYIVSYLAIEQRLQRQELAQANRKLVRYATTLEQLATIRERNRLARELHDTLAHTLSGLTVQLEALAAVWQPEADKAQQILSHALNTARSGLDETRRALQDMRAAPLDDGDLAASIRRLAQNVAARSALELVLDIEDGIGDLPSDIEQTFYRVAQEALENVVRHAQARSIAVTLRRVDDQLLQAVQDDGLGFCWDETAAQDRLGLRGMRERAALIGGALTVEAQPGSGTLVRLTAEIEQ